MRTTTFLTVLSLPALQLWLRCKHSCTNGQGSLQAFLHKPDTASTPINPPRMQPQRSISLAALILHGSGAYNTNEYESCIEAAFAVSNETQFRPVLRSW